MSIPGTHKVLWIMAIMAATPLLAAARAARDHRDPGMTSNFRPNVHASMASDVHKRLAVNYRKDADGFDAEAKNFTVLAEARRKPSLIGQRRLPTAVLKIDLYDVLAVRYEKMALEARNLGEMNEEMARLPAEQGRPANSAPQQSAPATPCARGTFVD